jgi:hypothetical protein
VFPEHSLPLHGHRQRLLADGRNSLCGFYEGRVEPCDGELTVNVSFFNGWIMA